MSKLSSSKSSSSTTSSKKGPSSSDSAPSAPSRTSISLSHADQSASHLRLAGAGDTTLLQHFAELEETQQRYWAIKQQEQQQGQEQKEGDKSSRALATVSTGVSHRSNTSLASTAVPASHIAAIGRFTQKKQQLAALTLDIIMALRMEQILAIQSSFETCGGSTTVEQFVAIMASHISGPDSQAANNEQPVQSRSHSRIGGRSPSPTSPHPRAPSSSSSSSNSAPRPAPALLLQCLIELFDSMDLDGDAALEFEEFLTTVVHMGLAATEHLLLTPISPYKTGPIYMHSLRHGEKRAEYIASNDALIIVEPEHMELRVYDPTFKSCFAVDFSLSSALAYCYISQLRLSYHSQCRPLHPRVLPPPNTHALFPRIAAAPLTKPIKIDGPPIGALIQGNSFGNKQGVITHKIVGREKKSKGTKLEKGASMNAAPFSFGAATPIKQQNKQEIFSSAATRPSQLPHAHHDFFLTSTSQSLQLWCHLPTGPAQLCDTVPIKASCSCLRFCSALQKVFTGDVQGVISIWRIYITVANTTQQVSISGERAHESIKLVKEQELRGHNDVITGLSTIPSMGYLLSSSLDTSVRMWDLQDGSEKNRFQGHRAGVVDLAYSHDYRFLLSAGSDHRVCVWSPFATQMVYALVGHTAPLLSVQFISGTPQIITCDQAGWVKVWDARNFACCQTFLSGAQHNITSITALPEPYKRLVVVGSGHEIYVYDQVGGPFLKRAQEEQIFAAGYSGFSMSFYTGNRTDVKVWDALNGSLSRIYRGLAESDLSSILLDARQRKLLVGDITGKIRVYNYLTGAYMKSLTPHEEEVIFLSYAADHRLVVSATDRCIYVHDERPIEEQVLHLSIRAENDTEYLCFASSEPLAGLAAATTDGKIFVWNLFNGMRDPKLDGDPHTDVITAMLFIDSQSLLVSADDSGCMHCWFSRPHRWRGQLAFILSSVFSSNLSKKVADFVPSSRNVDLNPQLVALAQDNVRIDKHNREGVRSGITCLTFHAPSNRLYAGHRNGKISVWDLTSLFAQINEYSSDMSLSWLTPFSIHGTNEDPYIKTHVRAIASQLSPTNIIECHSTPIMSLTMSLDPPALLSTTSDHIARIYSLDGECLGMLDPVQALQKNYGGATNDEEVQYKFIVDVKSREKRDLNETRSVLKNLEQLALTSASPSALPGATPSLSSPPSSRTLHTSNLAVAIPLSPSASGTHNFTIQIDSVKEGANSMSSEKTPAASTTSQSAMGRKKKPWQTDEEFQEQLRNDEDAAISASSSRAHSTRSSANNRGSNSMKSPSSSSAAKTPHSKKQAADSDED